MKVLCISPTQLNLDEADKMHLDVYAANIKYYNDIINDYKRDRKQTRIKMSMIISNKLKEMDIDKTPGSVVYCNDLVLICGEDGKFHYATLEDEI